MATFEVEHTEGMRWVRVYLDDNDMRAVRGALNHMVGALTMDVPLPTLRAWWVSLFSDESVVRPRYSGTGTVYLDSTLGGYHIMKLAAGDRWVLDTKCFWASDGQVQLSIHREPMLTAFWAGEGLLWYKTALKGEGQVVLSVDGPVHEVELNDETLITDGPFVIARTQGISMQLKRPAKNLISYWLSGQKRAYVYKGTGKLILCTVPYWRARMQKERAGWDSE